MVPGERSIRPVYLVIFKYCQFSFFFFAALKKGMLSPKTLNGQLWTEQGDGASCPQEFGFFSVPLVLVFL